MNDDLKIGDRVRLRNWDRYADPKIKRRGNRGTPGTVRLMGPDTAWVEFDRVGNMGWLYGRVSISDRTRIEPKENGE